MEYVANFEIGFFLVFLVRAIADLIAYNSISIIIFKQKVWVDN